MAFALFCTLSFLASYFILYPGFMTSDSFAQLSEARTGVFSDGHPPLTVWLWRNVEHLFPGRPGILALQLGALWSGIYLCSEALQRKLIWRIALSLALFLFPPVLGWAGALTKDALMLALALIGTGLVLRIGQGRNLRPPLLLPGIAFVFFLICSVRHNGLFLVAGLAFLSGLLLLRSSGWRSAALIAPLLFLLPLCSARLLDRALTDTRVYPAAGLLSFDFSGVAIRHSKDSEFRAKYQGPAAHALLRPGHTLEELGDRYRPEDWLSLTAVTPQGKGAPIIGHWDSGQMSALLLLWKAAVLEYPVDYLAHRANVTLSLLAWGKRAVTDPACFRDRDPAQITPASQISDTQRILSWRTHQLVQKTPLFRPWVYYITGWILLCGTLILRPRNWQIPTGLLISGLLHESALFILTPAAEYRYSAWMMVAVILAAFSLLQARPYPSLSAVARRP